MTNATSNSTAVVLIENDLPGAALERRKPAKLRRSLSCLDLVVWPHYEYGVWGRGEGVGGDIKVYHKSRSKSALLMTFQHSEMFLGRCVLG